MQSRNINTTCDPDQQTLKGEVSYFEELAHSA